MNAGMNFYVDESIHDRADFIVVAAVGTTADLQQQVFQALLDCGFDPAKDEFKSSMRMDRNPAAQALRLRLQAILRQCKIAVAVCPPSERQSIVSHAAKLLSTIDVFPDHHIGTVHFDEGMKRTSVSMPGDATPQFGCDSKLVVGIQVADCAAHVISTMLLGELGLFTKTVAADTVYEGQEGEIELAWTLWAGVRHALAGKQAIGELDRYGDPLPVAQPFGLVVSEGCSAGVKAAVAKRLGTVWVGCIH